MLQKKSENVRGRGRGWASENSITHWVSHTDKERENQQTRRGAAWEEEKGQQKLGDKKGVQGVNDNDHSTSGTCTNS